MCVSIFFGWEKWYYLLLLARIIVKVCWRDQTPREQNQSIINEHNIQTTEEKHQYKFKKKKKKLQECTLKALDHSGESLDPRENFKYKLLLWRFVQEILYSVTESFHWFFTICYCFCIVVILLWLSRKKRYSCDCFIIMFSKLLLLKLIQVIITQVIRSLDHN